LTFTTYNERAMTTAVTKRTVPFGLFITLEGIDGSGKTTAAKALHHWLDKEGYDVILTHEPGGTEFGYECRKLFLEHHKTLAPEAEIGLLVTAKAELMHKVIRPALAAGKIVICDRYTDTLFAYQGGGKGHDLKLIDKIVIAMGCNRDPDYTFFIDVRPQVALSRAAVRTVGGGEDTDFDRAGVEFRDKLIAGFKKRLHSRDPLSLRHTRIDGEQSMPRVLVDIQSHIFELLKPKDNLSAALARAEASPDKVS
jgi:dTMP kinase